MRISHISQMHSTSSPTGHCIISQRLCFSLGVSAGASALEFSVLRFFFFSMLKHKLLIICLQRLASCVSHHCRFVLMHRSSRTISRSPNFLRYFGSYSFLLLFVSFLSNKQKTIHVSGINFCSYPFLTPALGKVNKCP